MNNDVIFTGCISEERLRALYHACDLNLFPVEEQTYGLVPFEALASGKLSLVSVESGAGILMDRLGICYPIRPDVESIVNAVFDVWKHPGRFEEAISRGRDYVKKTLRWEYYAEKVLEVYEAVCN